MQCSMYIYIYYCKVNIAHAHWLQGGSHIYLYINRYNSLLITYDHLLYFISCSTVISNNEEKPHIFSFTTNATWSRAKIQFYTKIGWSSISALTQRLVLWKLSQNDVIIGVKPTFAACEFRVLNKPVNYHRS